MNVVIVMDLGELLAAMVGHGEHWRILGQLKDFIGGTREFDRGDWNVSNRPALKFDLKVVARRPRDANELAAVNALDMAGRLCRRRIRPTIFLKCEHPGGWFNRA